jgi:hypothetical protein
VVKCRLTLLGRETTEIDLDGLLSFSLLGDFRRFTFITDGTCIYGSSLFPRLFLGGFTDDSSGRRRGKTVLLDIVVL